jgi:CO/xanthine dehydrogenase Mo-binding subunit
MIIKNGKIYVKDSSKVFVTTADVVKACASEGISLQSLSQFNAPFGEVPNFKSSKGKVVPDFTFGSHAVEVAVDVETGTVEVQKIVACFDVGRAINPLSVEGQIEGGTIMGMGYALKENLIIERGEILTPSLSEIIIPTSMDTPDVDTIILESGDGIGPFGAKGIGEPCIQSIAPAIANAIFDAIGMRIYELPITPEKILRTLEILIEAGD